MKTFNTDTILSILKWDDQLRTDLALLASQPKGSGRFLKARTLLVERYPDIDLIGVDWIAVIKYLRGGHEH